MVDAPAFDPNKPFDAVAAPPFDPGKPFEAANPSTGAWEAAGRGFLHGASAGFHDESEGVKAAAGLPHGFDAVAGPGGPLGGLVNPAASVAQHGIGLARLAYEHLTGERGPATEAYEQARDAVRTGETTAKREHPIAFGSGELGGAGATMLGAPVARAATLPGQILHGAEVGATYGAASGAGEANGDALDRAIGATKGALSGAAGGAGGTLAGRALGAGLGYAYDKLGRPVVSLARGVISPDLVRKGINAVGEDSLIGRGLGAIESRVGPDAEAARRTFGAIARDYPHVIADESRGLTPTQYGQAAAQGEPVMLADMGGETTRALLRSAANTSPEGRNLINSAVGDRFATQSERVANDVRNLVAGGADANASRTALKAAYDAERGAAYRTAYDAGDHPIWSPELERLASSRSVVGAIKNAVETGNDRAVAEGYGGFNPGVTVTPDGRLVFNRGPNGVPTYPNMQFWDYTYRGLRDASGAAARAGRNDEAGALGNLAGRLRSELDRQVPAYRKARGVAADYFGANDALEAGQKAASFTGPPAVLQQQVAKMSPAELALFREGYADAKASRVLNLSDSSDVTKRLYNSPNERARMAAVFGEDALKPIETRMRLERIMDLARGALGNSTTARQLIEAGLAGGSVGAYLDGWRGALEGAGAGLAGAKVGAFNLARAGAEKLVGRVDQNTARRVAEMLTSQDPEVLRKGIEFASKNRRITNGLRMIEGQLGTVGGARAAPNVVPQLPGPAPASADQNQRQRGGRADAEPDEGEGDKPHYADGGAVHFKEGSEIGLAENAPRVHFQCHTCKYMDKVKGLCMNNEPKLYGRHVKPEYCCNLYDRPGMRVIV